MHAVFLALALMAPQSLAPQSLAPQSLADLSWLTGEWRMDGPARMVTETWLPAEGGMMPGVNRTVKGDKAAVEFMLIDEKDGAIAFTALLPGQPPTTFPARSVSAEEVVFENPDHDFPQRVIYRRCEADLCAAIEGTVKGELKRIEWRFSRVR